MPTSSNTNPKEYLPGDPECPHCQGIGYLRKDSLKKLARSRECNQFSRHYAENHLKRQGGL